jgi:hypothetical protein
MRGLSLQKTRPFRSLGLDAPSQLVDHSTGCLGLNTPTELALAQARLLQASKAQHSTADAPAHLRKNETYQEAGLESQRRQQHRLTMAGINMGRSSPRW